MRFSSGYLINLQNSFLYSQVYIDWSLIANRGKVRWMVACIKRFILFLVFDKKMDFIGVRLSLLKDFLSFQKYLCLIKGNDYRLKLMIGSPL